MTISINVRIWVLFTKLSSTSLPFSCKPKFFITFIRSRVMTLRYHASVPFIYIFFPIVFVLVWFFLWLFWFLLWHLYSIFRWWNPTFSNALSTTIFHFCYFVFKIYFNIWFWKIDLTWGSVDLCQLSLVVGASCIFNIISSSCDLYIIVLRIFNIIFDFNMPFSFWRSLSNWSSQFSSWSDHSWCSVLTWRKWSCTITKTKTNSFYIYTLMVFCFISLINSMRISYYLTISRRNRLHLVNFFLRWRFSTITGTFSFLSFIRTFISHFYLVITN